MVSRRPDSTRPLRVLLADDHAVVREGYRRLLELSPGVRVVGECADGEQVRSLLSADPAAADVLVLDLSMPGCGGLAVLRHVAQVSPALRVLVFTMHDAAALVAQALRAGAAGFVTKSSAPQVLVDAVHRVAAGETAVLSPDIAQRTVELPGAPPLAPREFEVLQLLVQGCSLDEVGRRLQLSAKTVANYQTMVRHKLGASSAIDLLRAAQRHGLVPG
ncbi:MAG TPA: response regulator transcription factor [Burkholderiaceae bacterium]|nr:response regulator transcription factor [Burkholderiaceae bacterium]